MGCGSCGKNRTVSRPREKPTEDVHGETGCDCIFSGSDEEIFCPRHNITKTPHQYNLCKKRRDYFQKWEEGRGPFQTATSNAEVRSGTVKTPEEKQAEEAEETKESSGLGDTIEKITKFTGIKAVVDAFTKASGKDCGCEGRKEWLNNKVPYKRKTKGFFE